MPNEHDPIATLLRRTAKRDTTAFRELYDLTSPRQLGIAIRILGRRDLAEEAIQDAYVSIWERAANFRPEMGSAQGWITTIVRRRAIDRLRASTWLKHEVVTDQSEAHSATATASENDLALYRCLDTLTGKMQVAIRLAYLYGMTHRELSEALEMPLGTIKSRLRRGLEALKECLET